MIQVDRRTMIQILGSLMARPNLLDDTDKYQIDPNDFTQILDRYIFSAIYNLYINGANVVHTIDVDNYLQSSAEAKTLLKKENGIAFLQDCEAYAEPDNFAYYYNKFKKINLLRELQRGGKDISKIYSDDPLDDNHTKINNRFEKLTTTDIINELKGELATLENKFVLNSVAEESNAYEGVRDLVEELSQTPEVGTPLQGEIFNTVVRGARPGKLYLRSASSGTGKTRGMVGDAASIAYPFYFDTTRNEWVSTGRCEKVLYVMTEQDPAEIQTMLLAYLTGYDESIFLYGTFGEEHRERIEIALKIMEDYKDNLLFARIADPCASVVKNLFRRYALQQDVGIFFFDYIFSSPAMLNEYRDLKLAEHVCLRLFTTALKNLAIELNVFILTATQTSNDDDLKNGGFHDYHNIRGSRSISDLVDLGCIMSRPTEEELTAAKSKVGFIGKIPNLITDVYKNRRGRWNMVRIWSFMDLSTCHKTDLFVTKVNNTPILDFQRMRVNRDLEDEDLELFNCLNSGEISDEKAEEILTLMNQENPEEIYGDFTEVPKTQEEEMIEAFETDEDKTKRLKDVSIGDLL